MHILLLVLLIILQMDMYVGTQWGDEPVGKVIREYCSPSVKKYCTKHGYDYQLFTESQYENHGGKFDFLVAKIKQYAIDKYYHLDHGYEKTVYLDTDIYVSEYAGKLPDIKGVMCSLESGGVSKNLFKKLIIYLRLILILMQVFLCWTNLLQLI